MAPISKPPLGLKNERISPTLAVILKENKMERSDQINELAGALSKAQAAFTNILKDNTAKIRTKSGAEYSYSYADLASLLDMVRDPLSKNGLSILQGADVTQEGKLIIETMLLHSSGQFIKNTLKLPIVETGNNAIQAIGSSITYGRRYEISSMLGIASELDDDAASIPAKPSTYQKAPPKVYDALAHNSNEDAITKEQGEALLSMLKLHGYTKDDLKIFIGETWGLNALTEIKNGHLMTIKKEFSKPKDLGLPEEVGT